MAIYDVDTCLDPKYRVDFETGFLDSRCKIEDLQKIYEKALDKVNEDVAAGFRGLRKRPPNQLRRLMKRGKRLSNPLLLKRVMLKL